MSEDPREALIATEPSATHHIMVLILKNPLGIYSYLNDTPYTGAGETIQLGDRYFRIKIAYPFNVSEDEAMGLDQVLTEMYGRAWAQESRTIAEGVRLNMPTQQIRQLMFELDPERYPLL